MAAAAEPPIHTRKTAARAHAQMRSAVPRAPCAVRRAGSGGWVVPGCYSDSDSDRSPRQQTAQGGQERGIKYLNIFPGDKIFSLKEDEVRGSNGVT